VHRRDALTASYCLCRTSRPSATRCIR
jgi:hypothetical protein